MSNFLKIVGSIGLPLALTMSANASEAAPSSQQAKIQAGFAISLEAETFEAPRPSMGSLLRTRQAVTFNGTFKALDANSSYTAWWMVFNNPSQCSANCDLEDFASGVGQIFYAGGFFTGEEGLAQVSATLPIGAIPEGAARFSGANDFDLTIPPESEIGLRQPFKSLVFLGVRNHGPTDFDEQPSQLAKIAFETGSYVGGCAKYDQGPNFPPGDFDCFDEQAVVFFPMD